MELLNLATGINFGANGNMREFDPAGFSPTSDAVSTWSEAGVAELVFRLPPLRNDLRFSLEVFPYLGDGKVTQQSCWVFFNGLFVHYQTVKAPVEMSFTVSRDVLSVRTNRLSFALPDARAPNELGLGNDLRLLGLAFVKLGVADARATAAAAATAAAIPPAAARRARSG